MPPARPWLSTDLLDEVSGLDFRDQLHDALSSLDFQAALPKALDGLKRTYDSFSPAPLPIVLSPRPSTPVLAATRSTDANGTPLTPETPPTPGAPPEPEQPAAQTLQNGNDLGQNEINTDPAGDVGVGADPDLPNLPAARPSPQGPTEPIPATETPRVGPAPAAANGALQAHARAMALKHGLDPDIFDRQLTQESGYNVNAQSGVGARGPGQFMPATGDAVARQMGLTPAQFWASPEAQIEGAALHMHDLLVANHGDYRFALAAYNAGQGNVDKYGEGVFGADFAHGQTRDYVNIILGPGAARPTAGSAPAAPPVAPAAAAPQQPAAGATPLAYKAMSGQPEAMPEQASADSTWTQPEPLGPKPAPARDIQPLAPLLRSESGPLHLDPGTRNRAVTGTVDEWAEPGPPLPAESPDARNRAVPGESPPPEMGGANWQDIPAQRGYGTIAYRQPLTGTSVSDLPYDPRDADQGAHEQVPETSGNVRNSPETPALSVSSYNDPTDQGTQSTPLPTPAESPFKPLYDLGGRITGYVHAGAEAVTSAVQGAADSAYQALEPARQAAASLDNPPDYGQVSSTPGEPDYTPPAGGVIRAITTPITAPPRSENPNDRTPEDIRQLPYQAAEAGRQAVEEAAQSFADAIRAGQEGRPLAAAGNALWGAIQTAGLPWTEAARTINAALPEMQIAGVGPGDVATSMDLVRDGINGVNRLRGLLTPENMAAIASAPGRVAGAVRNGAEAVAEGGRALGARLGEGLQEGRRVASELNAAEPGGTVLPGTLGVISDNPLEASRAARGRVVPPAVADTLDFPIRVPDDPAVVRAIEAVGGSVDPERGVDLYVTRAQGPEAHGAVATRGGVFYEAVPEGGRSSYVAGQGAQTGGPEVIPRTPTRFRSPLILSDAPGDARGFDEGMAQLHPGASQAERDAAQAAWEEARTTFPAKFDKNYNMVPTPEETAAWNRLQALDPVTSRIIDQEIGAARAAGPEGSSQRAAALKDLVTRYGGDPTLIDDLLRIRGADASESAWAIKENILAANARKAGYDGVVTVQPQVDKEAAQHHPVVMQALDALMAVKKQTSGAGKALDAAIARGRKRGLPFDQIQQTPEYREAFNNAVAAEETAKAAEKTYEQIRLEHASTSRITELADVREGRNPTPATQGEAWQQAQAKVTALDARVDAATQAMDRAEIWGTPDEWKATRKAWGEARRELDAAVDAREALRSETPGYSLREDIPRRPETRGSTITENPRWSEARQALVAADARRDAARQALDTAEAAHRAQPNRENWQALQKAETEAEAARTAQGEAYRAFEATAGEGRYITAQATLGAVGQGVSAPTDRLGAVNRVLGQGVASSVSGGVGAAINQQMNPDDPNAGLKGFAVGALAPALVSRGILRAAGKGAEEARGALGTLGNVPAGPRRRPTSPAARLAAAGGRAIGMTPAEEAARLRLDKFPEELRGPIREAAESLGFAHDARRGVIPDAAAENLADEIGKSADDWIKGTKVGKALNTEETRALRNVMAGQARKVDDLARQVTDAEAAGVTTNLLLVQAHAEAEKLAGLVQYTEGARAEAGRALRAWRAEPRPLDPNAAAQQIIKKFGSGPEARQRAIDALGEFQQIPPEDVIARASFWARVERGKITTNDVLTAVRYNSMLSSPRTWEVGWIGSVLQMPFKGASDVLAALTRPGSGEIGAALKGNLVGFQRGIRPLLETITHGITSEQAAGGALPRGLAVKATGPVGRALGTAIDLPGRMVAAPDALFSSVFRQAELGRQAALGAYKQGLKGAERDQFVLDFLTHPPKAMDEQITRTVDRMMLRGDMGTFGNVVGSFGRNVPGGELYKSLVLPFMKVAYHIWTQGVELTPVGAVGTAIDVGRGALGRGPYAAGFGAERAAPHVRPLAERLRYNALGLGVTGFALGQAFDGNISGAGPDDPNQKAMLRAKGWQPYSVKLGGNWYTYSNWGPLAVPLASAAAIAENRAYRKPTATPEKDMLDMTARVGKLVGDQSFLQGIGTLVNAYQEPDRYLPQFLANMATSFIPYGSGLNVAGQALDPTQRRPDRLADIGPAAYLEQSVASRLPGLRTDVPAAQTPLGQAVPNDQTGPAALEPFRFTTAREQPVIDVFLKTGVDIPQPRDQLTFAGARLDLTAEERRRWNELRGEALIRGVAPYTRSDALGRLPSGMAEKILRQQLDQAAQQADLKLVTEMAPQDRARRLQDALKLKYQPKAS